MIRSILAPIAFGVSGLALALSLAHAQSGNYPGMNLQQQSAMVWQQMRNCAQQAALKFPDHTSDGNAKREAERLDCLRRNHLPVVPQPQRYY
jgi:ABC-type sugar transport system substrate-binding protein